VSIRRSAAGLAEPTGITPNKGGICFGDSGGPDLIGGTGVVVGVNSYVTNLNRAGVTYSFRIDSPEVLSWIQSFL
jgi:hypothetical protein